MLDVGEGELIRKVLECVVARTSATRVGVEVTKNERRTSGAQVLADHIEQGSTFIRPVARVAVDIVDVEVLELDLGRTARDDVLHFLCCSCSALVEQHTYASFVTAD